jgi:hypothetical protein
VYLKNCDEYCHSEPSLHEVYPAPFHDIFISLGPITYLTTMSVAYIIYRRIVARLAFCIRDCFDFAEARDDINICLNLSSNLYLGLRY